MKIIFGSTIFMIVFITASCNSNKEKDKIVITDITQVEEKDEPPPPPPPPDFMKRLVSVTARMIYDDGTLSSFDVLNDKTKTLWNVIIGEGDAEKPSNKTRLLLEGPSDSIDLIVKRGKYTVINKKNLSFRDSMVFVIDKTGCEEVVVEIRKHNLSGVYKKSIEYHCGE